jgi:hypothetical protein
MWQKRLAALRDFNVIRFCCSTAQPQTYSIPSPVRSRPRGRQHPYRVQDLLIVSQAVQHGFGPLARNRRDFEDIPGLDLTLYVLAEQKRG